MIKDEMIYDNKILKEKVKIKHHNNFSTFKTKKSQIR